MPASSVTFSPDDPMRASGTNLGLLSAIPYPSPYFDLAQTYFPASIKELFQFCVYFYNTHCIVPAVVTKLASYPITELVYATDDENISMKWKNLLEDNLNLPFELFQCGIDMGVYGNSFIGVYFPFERFLFCKKCNTHSAFKAVKDKKVKRKDLAIVGRCPHCDKIGVMKREDRYRQNVKRVRLIRYDPMAIDIIADPVSGEKAYIWDPPSAYKDAILKGKDLGLFERCPEVVLEAIRKNHKVRLSSDNLFHMRRPSLSGQHASWGFPLIMHALKSLYYLQVLKMAQEAIAIQHVIPLWILFPQGGSGGSNMPPAAAIDLRKWKSKIEEELALWRKDRNHIPIVNFPVGFEQIGGEGRALLLGPEVQQEIQQVIASMSVPQEFVFGGLTWTGSSITLRMLENTFQGMRTGFQRFIRFLVGIFSKYFGYKQIDIYMSELKMADDVQRQQIMMNLEAAGKISTTRLLSELNFDLNEEMELKKKEFVDKLTMYIRESIMSAKAQGEAGLVSMDYQLKAQEQQMQAQEEMMGEQGAVPPGASPGGLMQDPNSGAFVDQNLGVAIDPTTGTLIDINSGEQITPEEYAAMGGDPSVLQQLSSGTGGSLGAGMDPMGAGMDPTGAMSMNPMMSEQDESALMESVPGVSPDNKIMLEAAAQAGLTGGMPVNIKAMVTRAAEALMFVDAGTQQQILVQMEQEMPQFAMLVKQRMLELTTLPNTSVDPGIVASEMLPPEMNPTTGME